MFLYISIPSPFDIFRYSICMNKSNELVILLHGLGLSSFTLRYIELGLARQGYETCNIDYPSREYGIESLIAIVLKVLDEHDISSYEKVHIVGHSLGGIIARYLALTMPEKIEKCIALGSPNNGSSLAQWLSQFYLIRRYFGPALYDLLPSSSFLSRLVSLPDEYHVIVGTRSKWTFFGWFFEERSDGTVSVSEVVPEYIDMKDVRYFDVSHASMLFSADVRKEIIEFLD